MKAKYLRYLRILVGLFATLALCVAVAWAGAALWFDTPIPPVAAGSVAAAYVLASLLSLFIVRPYRRALLICTVFFSVVLVWWLNIPASNHRDWLPDVAKTAQATVSENILTIHNLRNFDYRAELDYTERWETRQYDLDKLNGVDLYLCYWGPTTIAHTIASWEFEDSPPLAISIETRKEKGEDYSAVLGFFRQFEIYYVVADERDVIRLRTNHRGEDLYLYRTNLSVDKAKALLFDYVKEINNLAQKPKWYNAFTHNCTTAIRYHLKHMGLGKGPDWRILANGYLDQVMYERKRVLTSMPFSELRQKSYISERAKDTGNSIRFSERIRKGLPNPRLTHEQI